MGLIQELIYSHDGNIRGAKVRSATGNVLTRPINLLYPFECADVPGFEEKSPSEQVEDLAKCNESRPAKKAAKERLSKYYKNDSI